MKESNVFSIGKRDIGPGRPTFIVAEVGVNHGGNMETARKLVEKAAECGADAVKFQTYITEKRVPKDSPLFDVLKKSELGKDEHRELAELARKRGLMFFSTPFDEESVDILFDLGVQVYKIPSFYITHKTLLRYIASKGLPVIVSRGMANKNEIDDAVGLLREAEVDFALLHCVSSYPTKPADANLAVMSSLRKAFGCVVGYSDHTIGVKVPLYAIAAGASIIEKHFTLDKNQEGPDHKLSADPADLSKIVSGAREIEKIMGSGRIEMIEAEKPILPYKRFS